MIFNKAQGSLEYLLIIGGAIVLAAIVLSALSTTSVYGFDKKKADAQCAPFATEFKCTNATIDSNGVSFCSWDSTALICKAGSCDTFADTNCPLYCNVSSGSCIPK